MLYFLSYFSHFVLSLLLALYNLRGKFRILRAQMLVKACWCVTKHTDPPITTWQTSRDPPHVPDEGQSKPANAVHWRLSFSTCLRLRSWYYFVFSVLLQDDYFHNFNSFICIGGFLLRCDWARRQWFQWWRERRRDYVGRIFRSMVRRDPKLLSIS